MVQSSTRAAPLALVIALVTTTAVAGEDLPPGPPWTSVCAPMEQGSFRQVFTSDQCQRDFEAAFAALALPEIHGWMAAHQDCFHEWAHFSWLAFLKQDPKMAQLAWEHQLEMIQARVLSPGEDTGDGVADGGSSAIEALLELGTVAEIGPDALAHTKAFLDQVELDVSYQEEMDAAYAAVTPICLYHLDTQCVGAMKTLLGWMYPRSYKIDGPPREWFTFSMMPLFREVFSDTATQQAASRLALDVLRRIDDQRARGVSPYSDDLYTVGLAAFGGDEDRFWKFMMVYATRGAAWATAAKLAHEETKPLFAAFMVISAAMGVLDTQAITAGSPWSYSPGARSTCFQPKPYHYWMAGGYAYLLRKEGYSARTSRLVARLLGAMYELGSTTMDRDPNAVFFVDTFDTIVNRTRREVSHHFLGAEFGVEPNPPGAAQDFDGTLLKLFEQSQPLPEMPDDEMWKKLEDAPTKWRYWTDLTGYYFRAE